MLSKKMEKALNDQINLEMFSAYTYLSMAAFFAEKNLDGFSNWMRLQFTEELQHAGKLFDYLIDRDAKVTLSPIKAPAKTWASDVELRGVVRDASPFVRLRIGVDQHEVKPGVPFAVRVPLGMGPNRLCVTATDVAGNRSFGRFGSCSWFAYASVAGSSCPEKSSKQKT